MQTLSDCRCAVSEQYQSDGNCMRERDSKSPAIAYATPSTRSGRPGARLGTTGSGTRVRTPVSQVPPKSHPHLPVPRWSQRRKAQKATRKPSAVLGPGDHTVRYRRSAVHSGRSPLGILCASLLCTACGRAGALRRSLNAPFSITLARPPSGAELRCPSLRLLERVRGSRQCFCRAWTRR